MEILLHLVNFILHIDKYLIQIVQDYGTLTYLILFGIVFMETGFVVTPFLPGDSLLFAAGALSSTGSLNILLLYALLVASAFLGDTVNYWIGHFIGPKVFERDHRLLKREYLYKAQNFYDKHGGKAIILARFVPIVRTFAPFVAGVGKMNYGKFILFNIIGGVAWVTLFLFSGFFFGNLPIIRDNFHYSVFAIVLLSIVPLVYEWAKTRAKKPKNLGE